MGCSALFGNSVVEEEMAALRAAVEAIMGLLSEDKR